MDKSSYTKAINVEEFLFERYQQIYDIAKTRCETDIMMLASDRQAAILGVSFAINENYEEDE